MSISDEVLAKHTRIRITRGASFCPSEPPVKGYAPEEHFGKALVACDPVGERTGSPRPFRVQEGWHSPRGVYQSVTRARQEARLLRIYRVATRPPRGA